MQKLPFKRGDSFSLLCTVDGNVTGWTIASQIRTSAGALVATLTAAVTSASADLSVYTLTAPGPTTAWPIEDLRCDIQYTTGAGIIDSTETFVIQMVEDVTQ